jgi:hypothetical protein
MGVRAQDRSSADSKLGFRSGRAGWCACARISDARVGRGRVRGRRCLGCSVRSASGLLGGAPVSALRGQPTTLRQADVQMTKAINAYRYSARHRRTRSQHRRQRRPCELERDEADFEASRPGSSPYDCRTPSHHSKPRVIRGPWLPAHCRIRKNSDVKPRTRKGRLLESYRHSHGDEVGRMGIGLGFA